MVRSAQKVALKKNKEHVAETDASAANVVILKPIGYPLTGGLDEYPRVEDTGVFECYARQQWNGYLARMGDYLFDHRMYPDFAYHIVDVEPAESIIGQTTSFIVADDARHGPTFEFTSTITFDDVIGQQMARRKCKLIERYLKEPEIFGQWAPTNVLFFGPAGTGKTMFAKALANKTSVPILPMKATELIGEFVGEGARQIHQLYEHAQEMAPCIIFIDELDAIALDRRFQELRGDVSEIVNALLTEMDGIVEHDGICTIGATNLPDTLDPAVRNRFEEEIEFTLPDETERAAIIVSNLQTFPLPVKDVDTGKLARATDGLSGRDIVEKVLKTALHQAIMDEKDEVTEQYLNDSVARMKITNEPVSVSRMYI
ncbi:MAG: AAA family ATPase [Methanosarcinaceae archaeon]|nr:AAA family ATPase [Methanosarcinaceae archaeon]